MTAFRARFTADDAAISHELKRHHPVLERRDQATGESTIQCSCGEAFGPLPNGESVLDLFVAHFLGALRNP